MDYDALRELATHLGGRAGGPCSEGDHPEEREAWRRWHADQRLEVRAVEPYDAAAIAALREEFAARLRALT